MTIKGEIAASIHGVLSVIRYGKTDGLYKGLLLVSRDGKCMEMLLRYECHVWKEEGETLRFLSSIPLTSLDSMSFIRFSSRKVGFEKVFLGHAKLRLNSIFLWAIFLSAITCSLRCLFIKMRTTHAEHCLVLIGNKTTRLQQLLFVIQYFSYNSSKTDTPTQHFL